MYLGHIWFLTWADHNDVASFAPAIPASRFVVRLLVIAVTIVFAYCVSALVEYPFIRLYKKDERGEQPSPAPRALEMGASN